MNTEESPPRRFQTSVRLLIAVVASCSVALWATRPFWDPALVAIGELRAPIQSRRVDALWKLGHAGVNQGKTVIPPLVLALADLEPEVRVAAAEALTNGCTDAVAAGSANKVVAHAVIALIGSLRDPERSVREAAANGLGSIVSLKGADGLIDCRAVTAALAAMLSDPNRNVGTIDSGAIVAAFATILGKPHDELRPVVLNAMAVSSWDRRVAPPPELLAILSDQSPADRAAAVTALGGFQCSLDPWIATLFKLLEHDELPVKSACAAVLDRTGQGAASANALPVLIDALGSVNAEVRLHAARALRPLASDPRSATAVPAILATLKTSLQDGLRPAMPPRPDDRLVGETADVAVWLLGWIAPETGSADEAIAILAEVIRAGPPRLRQSAADSLERFGPAAQAPLIGLLNDRQPGVRLAAAKALESMIRGRNRAGMIDVEGTFSALSEVLGDRDEAVRIAVLDALGATAQNSEMEPPDSLAACLSDQSAGVRIAAIESLACFRSGLDRWITSIFEVLEREADVHDRSAALRALLRVHAQPFSAPSILALTRGLGTRHSEVRCAAAYLLSTLGTDAAQAIPALIEAMSCPLDPTFVGPGKLDDPWAWDPAVAATRALSQIAPGTRRADEVIRALTDVLQTGHPRRRVVAAHALGRFGPAAVAAVPALIDVVKMDAVTEPGRWDGASAATALGWIAPDTPLGDEVVAVLIEALRSGTPSTRQSAIEALTRFGPKAATAISRLRDLRAYPDPSIRAAAVNALSALGADE
jgi:HEAT repeat protein